MVCEVLSRYQYIQQIHIRSIKICWDVNLFKIFAKDADKTLDWGLQLFNWVTNDAVSKATRSFAESIFNRNVYI